MSLFAHLWSSISFLRDSRSLGSSQATKGRSHDGAIQRNGTLPKDPVETVVVACSYKVLALFPSVMLGMYPIFVSPKWFSNEYSLART